MNTGGSLKILAEPRLPRTKVADKIHIKKPTIISGKIATKTSTRKKY